MARVSAALLEATNIVFLHVFWAASSPWADSRLGIRGACVPPMQQYSEDREWHLPSRCETNLLPSQLAESMRLGKQPTFGSQLGPATLAHGSPNFAARLEHSS